MDPVARWLIQARYTEPLALAWICWRPTNPTKNRRAITFGWVCLATKELPTPNQRPTTAGWA
eukprot:8352812-Lingulodinium_polyedra.AAC.1